MVAFKILSFIRHTKFQMIYLSKLGMHSYNVLGGMVSIGVMLGLIETVHFTSLRRISFWSYYIFKDELSLET